ncbi:Vascular endothelial growth factor receptor 2 [Folsomia candida]|uniref:Vascular endothelial growth factor receptor 2 n=1 Tax=Folsomia candida TaxID=158441 RepID=A0A226E2U7_FOLCA|nr:Vascular endothelial growth factor receptor 2 [Folsomia candida]
MFFLIIVVKALFWTPSECQNHTGDITTINETLKINLQLANNEVDDWENPGMTLKNWEFVQINNETVLVSLTKFELDLTCEAPFPIEWNITGHIGAPDFIHIQPYKREIANLTDDGIEFLFKLQILIFFDPGKNVTSASARIYCQHAMNPKISKSYAVFLRHERHPFVNSGQLLTVVDSKVIPCPTTDPKLSVNLIAQNGRPISPVNYLYDPLIGFQFQNMVQGNFTCVTLNDTVSVSATITRTIPGYNYIPKTPHVKIFTDEELVLKCSRGDGTGNSGSSNIDIIVSISMNHTLSKTTQIDSLTNSTIVTAKIHSFGGNGSASCVNVADQRNIWTWGLEFVEPPTLVLNNFEGEVNCGSEYNDRSVATVRCRDPPHCEYMKHCFANPNLCNFNIRKQFYSSDSKRCFNPVLGEGYDCASVPYAHLNGAVACQARGLLRYFMFFVSLQFLRRSSWQELQPSELIQMDDVEPILYTNNTSTFLCRAVAFLFADDLKFSIEFKNKTQKFLQGSSFNITVLEGSSSRKVDEYNVLAELKIDLPIDAVSIHCHAPWMNSTEFYDTERRFETRHLLHPKISATKDQAFANFVTGKTTQRLNCSGFGEPQPTYRWFKDGIPIQNSSVSESTQITTGSNGESFLEFLKVDDNSAATYLCVAENIVGNDSFSFKLNTIEEDSSSVTYEALIGTILFVLTAVIIVLAYVVNRYLKAQARLTENEIDEFFKGRPELVNSSQALKADNLDLMPYDVKYEVELDDVEFDASEVLGSGEFSVVVKGRMKSKNMNVAIKIAKPSADVTLFKTLLSEVKIMIFIENHENIVALFGVCTRNIRTRNIHIVLEFCENGSLETYLRKGRARFINLIDQNQRLSLQVLKSRPDAEDRLSSLDLIKWAMQIAKGMEYLSFKGVVHADLAARNILLNTARAAKISDFGLSKKLYECTNYVKKTKSPLPWRWMSIEALSTLTFSKESDVWAYAVTLWEIFSLGDTPFPSETWDKDFLHRITSGMRMGRPKFATFDIYSQMVNCWDDDPMGRPEFSSLRKYFSNLIEKITNEQIPQELGSEHNLTFLREPVSTGGESDGKYYTNDVNLYANMNPEGLPQYANYDPSSPGRIMYSNVP